MPQSKHQTPRPARGMEHNMLFSQDIIDRANEWLSEQYPELDGPAYDAKLFEVCSELANIDAARDAE